MRRRFGKKKGFQVDEFKGKNEKKEAMKGGMLGLDWSF